MATDNIRILVVLMNVDLSSNNNIIESYRI
jgi:hypothetical protein